MAKNKKFVLEVLVDFPDDALSCPWPITVQHIDSMMECLAHAGVGRVIWGWYGDGHGGYLMPSGISGTISDPTICFDQNQWKAYAQTLDILVDPFRVAVEAGHRRGIEVYAYFKPYETGISMDFAEGSPQAREWGRLPRIGGYLTWMDPFVLKNPNLRIKRRTDDLRYGIDSAIIHTIRLTRKNALPTRIRKENIEIWTSDRNYRYTKKNVDFSFSESIETAPEDVYDVYGNFLTGKGDPVRVLTLSGVDLKDRFILLTTNFKDERGDFSNAWDKILACYDAEGREIAGVYATGTAIWFPEWEDFRNGGMIFDTGRGPEEMTLDIKNLPGKSGAALESSKYHLPGQRKVQGCIAFARGKNAYLPGGLCETEPSVCDFWLSCVREMLDAGADGVEFRVENHSCHTDAPQDYGFNDIVLEQLQKNGLDFPAGIAQVRGRAYTDFLRKAKVMISSAGRKMRVNLNLDWFRPAHERPGARKLAYPANIDFNWQDWIEQGIVDEAMLRPFAKPFSGIFKDDAVAQEMIERCQKKNIPVSVNRYVWCNSNLSDEFRRVLDDGRFSGFVLYETWSFMEFDKRGGCNIAGKKNNPALKKSEIWQQRAMTGRFVQKVSEIWKSRS